MSSDEERSPEAGEPDEVMPEEERAADEPAEEQPAEERAQEGLPPEEEQATEGRPEGESRMPRYVLLGSAALAVAAFVVAAVFGVMWWAASADESADVASAREDVVQATGNAVAAFTELDYQNPDAYFSRQKEVAIGDLRKQIERSEKTYRKAIADAKTKVVSTIQDVAVSELNTREGKASALATVSNEVTQGGKKSTKTLRLEVQMTRVEQNGEQVWKLSNIGEVPVVGSGQ